MADDLEAYGKKLNKFHLESEMSEQYYLLTKGNAEQSFIGVTPYYPKVTESDYKNGVFSRFFIVRYTGEITEISKREASIKKAKLPKSLYYYIPIQWRIVDSTVLPMDMIGQSPSTSNVNMHYIKVGSKLLPVSLRSAFIHYFSDLNQFKLST